MSKKTASSTSVFTKAQLSSSETFCGKRDILAAILEDGTFYTKQQAEGLVNQFLKGKVE